MLILVCYPVSSMEKRYNGDFLKKLYLAQLKAERYPYYRKRKVDLSKQPIEKLLEQILSVFDISFSQFEDMDFESQYLLQHDLFDALVPVIRKHFFGGCLRSERSASP